MGPAAAETGPCGGVDSHPETPVDSAPNTGVLAACHLDRATPSAWRAALPTAALLVIALTQIVLTRTADLTPWKGGGFGMFSATDDAPHRRLRIFVSAPERSAELEIAGSLESAADRAVRLPSHWQLARLARLVVERERRHGRAVETVRIECWRTEYDVETLAATWRRFKEFVFRAEAVSATSP